MIDNRPFQVLIVGGLLVAFGLLALAITNFAGLGGLATGIIVTLTLAGVIFRDIPAIRKFLANLKKSKKSK